MSFLAELLERRFFLKLLSIAVYDLKWQNNFLLFDHDSLQKHFNLFANFDTFEIL